MPRTTKSSRRRDSLHRNQATKTVGELQRLCPGFESIEAATKFDSTMVRRLQKLKAQENSELVSTLKCALESEHPTNAASHLATTLFRARLANALIKFSSSHHEQPVQAVAIPSNIQLAPEDITKRDLVRMKGRFKKRLERCGLGHHIVIAAIDYSLNEHSEDAWRSYWQPHLTIWVFGASPKQVHDLLKKQFSATSHNTHRPVRCDEIKPAEIPRAATYLLKARYSRRVKLRQKRLRTSNFALTPYDNKLLPLLRALAGIEVRDRLILIGCRFDGNNITPTA